MGSSQNCEGESPPKNGGGGGLKNICSFVQITRVSKK